ncbi:lytic transglycosylase domain-containing protein [Noviherbaspirillum sp. UKPF54]|uniref:lytic transglycosylase domain-containing protein n=1 Tax=Noviherbaspirillum sp. UKPF54 TaxID=2601898 RepID=UPI0011B1447F|nr:lytic transglycosylase domain-containing protein [Noviherbaspirillum sp. UKPF54]QDZ29627.1 lytic transglycosylase domain-containing protein [Noviherbaspirillum sp. UKPF54]
MYAKEVHREGSRLPAPRQAAGLLRAARAAACIAVAMLLGACSGALPFQPDHQAQQGAATTYSTPGKPKHMRATTARDILAEWSTFGIERKSARRGRLPDTMHSYDAPPELAMSVDDIMANATCHACEQKPYHQMVLNAARQHGVPASLIHAVIQKESGYQPGATSKRHARGLMQITPETGRFVGVHDSRRLYDPQTNINAGAAYLKYLMSLHDTVDKVLAAYNSGPGTVRKYKGVPPFRETRRYVRDVKKYYASAATRPH